ncbi:MAG: hypothetical protein JW821_04050 [Deltaproteobacteria bacterium]|nr:hypothetical protein [Deltaproteobacteria bacterium]
MNDIFEQLKGMARELWNAHGLQDEEVQVRARALTPEEAIGNPDAADFPIQKGKERLMQAEIRGARGQAFTDRYGDYAGTLEEIAGLPLTDNYRRAVFVAALNASLRHLHLVEGTVHCRDQEPVECAKALSQYILEGFGSVKITQVGFQPRMVESLSSRYPLRVLDLDRDNIGSPKSGVMIEGPEATAEAVQWADLLLVTGTALVNGTLPLFLCGKPLLFYGTTIAGAACLMGWNRFCERAA